jgi:hypothetical protein
VSEANEAFDAKLQNVLQRVGEGGQRHRTDSSQLDSVEVHTQNEVQPSVKGASSNGASVESSACSGIQKDSHCQMPTETPTTDACPEKMADAEQHHRPEVKSQPICQEKTNTQEFYEPLLGIKTLDDQRVRQADSNTSETKKDCVFPNRAGNMTGTSLQKKETSDERPYQKRKVKSLFGCREEIRLLEASSGFLTSDMDHPTGRASGCHPFQSVR